jgi:hypothetical protein
MNQAATTLAVLSWVMSSRFAARAAAQLVGTFLEV